MTALLINKIFRKFFLISAVLLLAVQPAAHAWDFNNDSGQGTIQNLPVESAVTSSIGGTPVSARLDNSGITEARDNVGGVTDKGSLFRFYVTPDDPTIEFLTAQINKPDEAYKIAVQWIYVSDQKLNGVADKWLTPHEFLTGTPDNSHNPVKGKAVSDCEEKANTLVSLMRATGVRPEDVRVVLGEVTFNDIKTGHAWVELFTGGHWLSLDPCWGPYWDDKTEKLVLREGVPFEYYAGHTYPVLQVWAYYNDTYYLDPRDGSGNAPSSWQ